MKTLVQYITEYKQRVKSSFDYDAIKNQIMNCKPKYMGNHVFIDVLWTPEIYFDYHNGWSAGAPRKDSKDNYKISLGASSVIAVEFFAMKNLFRKNEFFGRIDCFAPTILSKEDEDNWEDIKNFLKSKFNAKDQGGIDYIKFESYDELEEILKALEPIINKYNTNYDKNNPSYLYFDKSEATENASDKKHQYEIVTIEQEIVNLTKQLEEIKNAEDKADTDLSALIQSINDKIEYYKKKKNDIK